MGDILDPAYLIDPSGIASRHGIGRATLSNWIARYPDFPKPVTTPLMTTRVYDVRVVDEWIHRNTRPSRTLRRSP